jgi:hypothetical protein
MVGTKVLKDLEKLPKGAFTLGVRDSSVESRTIMLVIKDLNLVAMKNLC